MNGGAGRRDGPTHACRLRNLETVTTIALVSLACIGLFVLGLIAPRLSIKEEGLLDRDLEHADRRVRRWPFPFNKLGDTSLKVSTWMVDRSTEGGRKVRRKLR